MYGHLYGENLEEDADDEEKAIEEVDENLPTRSISFHDEVPDKEVKRMGICKTFFTLIKSFLGTGLLLMAKGFANGGYAFSIPILIISAVISGVAGQELIETRSKVRGSFSEIAHFSFGLWARVIADIVMVLAQLTFVIAYVDFICLNVREEIAAWSHSDGANIWYYGLACFVILTPLVFVRHLEKFAMCHFFADFMVVLMILTVVIFSGLSLHDAGRIDPGAVSFNQSAYFLYFGTAIFAFEGVGVVIPIYESMEKPEYFLCLWWITMVAVTTIYIIMGLIPYFAYGEEGLSAPFISQTIAAVYPNLWNQIVNVLYAVALVPTYVLIVNPAVHVLEIAILKGRVPETKHSALRKWLKNLIRTIVVAFTVVIAIVSADSLDYMLGIVSTISCTPVGFIFPAAFHLRNMKPTGWRRCVDWFIIVFGFVVIVVILILTFVFG